MTNFVLMGNPKCLEGGSRCTCSSDGRNACKVHPCTGTEDQYRLTAQRGSSGVALFHDHGTRRGEASASRPGRSLPPGKTRYPLCRRLGGPQGRSGKVRRISPPPGFDPRPVQPVARQYTDWVTRPTKKCIYCWENVWDAHNFGGTEYAVG
jgi:hypothetical protein